MQIIKNAVRTLVQKVEMIRIAINYSEERLFANDLSALLRKDTIDFIRKRMPHATHFPRWQTMFDYAIKNMPKGLLLEFGVAKGKTINYLADRMTDRQAHGFDSFIGFPEEYVGHVTSLFDFKGNLPPVRKNVVLHPGFFEKTLPPFVAEHKGENVAFIHVDCDLYSSTKTVFDNLKHNIHDTFVQFDELFNYWCWEIHELKAFDEFLAENKDIQCEYVGFSFRQALVRLRRVK